MNVDEQYKQAYETLRILAKSLALDEIAVRDGRVNRLIEHTRQYNEAYDFIRECEVWAEQVGYNLPIIKRE